MYDLILVSAGTFRDAEGRLITRWEVGAGDYDLASPAVYDELDALRRQVAELAERVEFTERLLAAPRRSAQAGPDQGEGARG